MALKTYAEIKDRINESLAELQNHLYPEDVIAEIADSEIPVYNNEVIAEWIELPMDRTDQWQEFGYDTQHNDGGILELMRVDLAIYYVQEFARVWEDVKAARV